MRLLGIDTGPEEGKEQMKSNAKITLAVLFALCCTLQSAGAAVSVDFSYFHERLAPYGNWMQHQRYGWVWQPTVVEVGWRPYTHGHWMLTDDYGWLWEADYDWGWAPFHYGRWAWDPEVGWVWVPGYEWGPAWVDWRYGDGYIGWAPLPPEIAWKSGVGLKFGNFRAGESIYRPSWVFVPEQHFLAPRLTDVTVFPERNGVLIEKTRDVTRYELLNNRIVNHSIDVERIERITGSRVQVFKVREVDTLASSFGRRVDPETIRVFRPAVTPSATIKSPPFPHDTERIHAAQRAIIEERHRAEQEGLAERHQRELEQPNTARDQLRQQHEAERQALIERQRSERHVFENQVQRDRTWHTAHARR
jgi:hypothetical protein